MPEILLNAEFDLSLRPRWAGPGSKDLLRLMGELSQQFLLAGGPEDSVLLHEPLPVEHRHYLEAHGLPVPRTRVLPEVSPELQLAPFGWNHAAADLNQRYRHPAAHPPPAVVALVNSRRFSAELELRLCEEDGGDGTPVIAALQSLGELQELLHRQTAGWQGWVVKSDHGSSGLGNRRLRSPQLEGSDRAVVESWLREDDWLVLEHWQPRATDLCTTFVLGADGTISELQVHEVVNTADGAFIGALFDPCSAVVDRWQEALSGTAVWVAGRLHQAGYHGPVCIDSYLWREGGRERLRPLVDLNARQHMSLPALRLWRRWQRRVVVYWRLFSTRKVRVPEDHEELCRALGEDAFDTNRCRGVLLTSPPRLGHGDGRRLPLRIGVLLAAAERASVLALEQGFRDRFERGVASSKTSVPVR